MNVPKAVPPLGRIDDDELERVAATWRAQARYGDLEAYGITTSAALKRKVEGQ